MKYVQEMFYLCNCRVSCQSIIYALLVVLQWNRQKCFWSILKDDHYGTPNRLTLTWISNVLVDIKIYRYTLKVSSSSSHTLQYFCLSRVILEYSKSVLIFGANCETIPKLFFTELFIDIPKNRLCFQ